jgi:hypothetical protein
MAVTAASKLNACELKDKQRKAYNLSPVGTYTRRIQLLLCDVETGITVLLKI